MHQHGSGQWQRPLLIFPNLRAVKLSPVNLDGAVISPSRKRGGVLLDCLEWRRGLGVGIRDLEVSDRDGWWVQGLREIVPSTDIYSERLR